MPPKRKTLSFPIYQLLVVNGFDLFTVKELRDAYMRCVHIRKEDAYRRAYRQVVRLLRNGLIEKTLNSNGMVIYRKTPAFHQTLFIQKRQNGCGDIPKNDFKAAGYVITELQSKAHQYQIDFLTSIGEAEEYQRLAKEFPSLRYLLDSNYQIAREKSSKFLGQLIAIENVISQHSQRAA